MQKMPSFLIPRHRLRFCESELNINRSIEVTTFFACFWGHDQIIIFRANRGTALRMAHRFTVVVSCTRFIYRHELVTRQRTIAGPVHCIFQTKISSTKRNNSKFLRDRHNTRGPSQFASPSSLLVRLLRCICVRFRSRSICNGTKDRHQTTDIGETKGAREETGVRQRHHNIRQRSRSNETSSPAARTINIAKLGRQVHHKGQGTQTVSGAAQGGPGRDKDAQNTGPLDRTTHDRDSTGDKAQYLCLWIRVDGRTWSWASVVTTERQKTATEPEFIAG
jgi:hypothetical protein